MKKIKLLVAALIVVAAGAFLFTNENLFKADVSENAVVEDGVFIGGIDVSGMTAEEAADAVNKYVEDIKPMSITLVGPKANMSLTLEEMGLTAQTDKAVQEAVSVGKSGNLISRFKALKDLESENYVVDMGLAIDKQATAESIYNKKSKIDIKAIDHGLEIVDGQFVYVEGQAGDEVDIETAVNELSKYIATDWELAAVENDEFTLTSIVSQPRGSEEELSVVKDLIGTFTTNYSSSGWGRAQNVENGASKINGTVLYPGDELSVYELVNPFTQENGYELAGSYVNGETVESFGGGICQVSTTLYNAALKAELEITQRYNHSMIVTYVDPSADAAIAGTYKDLRIKNNYDFPVYVEGVCKSRNITFNIYGVETRAENRTVDYESVVVTVNDPATEFTLDPAQALGVFTQTRSEHIGYVAELYKVVKVDGVEQERARVNKSTYQASARKVTVGIAGASADQIAVINNAIATAVATGDDTVVESTIAALITPVIAEPVPVVPEEPVVTEPETSEEVVEEEEETPDQESSENPNETPEEDTSETPEEGTSETPDVDDSKEEN